MHLNIICLFFTNIVYAQNRIDWDGKYSLVLSDFKSKSTKIGDVNFYTIYSAATFYFSFQMTNAEFMFTKNFNSKVDCYFLRDAALITAPDSSMANNLLALARYEFDLAELFARKFRKRIYESKGAFSDVSFFRPLFDETQKEFSERQSNTFSETEIGQNQEKLNELHKTVITEIQELSDFCKECKPIKKRK
jgi:hypothetical protein